MCVIDTVPGQWRPRANHLSALMLELDPLLSGLNWGEVFGREVFSFRHLAERSPLCPAAQRGDATHSELS